MATRHVCFPSVSSQQAVSRTAVVALDRRTLHSVDRPFPLPATRLPPSVSLGCRLQVCPVLSIAPVRSRHSNNTLPIPWEDQFYKNKGASCLLECPIDMFRNRKIKITVTQSHHVERYNLEGTVPKPGRQSDKHFVYQCLSFYSDCGASSHLSALIRNDHNLFNFHIKRGILSRR